MSVHRDIGLYSHSEGGKDQKNDILPRIAKRDLILTMAYIDEAYKSLTQKAARIHGGIG